MPTGNDKFQAAADEASCVFLLAAGGTAARVAAYSLLTGNLVVGGLAAAATGIAVYAYGKGCTWDSTGAEYPQDVQLECCPPLDTSGNKDTWWKFRAFRLIDQQWITVEIGYSFTNNGQYNRGQIIPPSVQGADGSWVLTPCGVSYTTTGTIGESFFDPTRFRDLHIVPPTGTGCDGPEAPLPPPYTYTDPDDGCQIQVTMLGWGVDGAGNYTPVWQMDPILPPAARASGSAIIGNCNFAPVVYYDGPGGPVLPPVPPDPVPGPGGEPWWVPVLWGALRALGDFATEKLLDELFAQKVPQWQFTMRAACNYKQDGTYETYTITLPEAPYQERMLQLAETQLDFLQQHLLWKTPTCSGGGSSASGDPVTVNFVSDTYTATGNNVLRKRFVYFDQTDAPLEDHVAHWKDFLWEAGPVWVGLKGTSLGTCQVWAATLDEGKRVIEHAASIAGVDVADGEWISGTARDPRYGQPGSMRVLQDAIGYYAVTKRSGPSGKPSLSA